MTTATLFSSVLAAAALEDQHSTEFVDVVAHVEVIDVGGDVQLVAYDATGDPIGSVAVWTDGPETHIASDFADGYEEIVIVDDDVRNDSTLAPDVATRRAEAMLDILAQSDPQEGKNSCALAIAANVAACANPVVVATVLVCMGSTYHTACACAEYIGHEPPEGWC